MARHEPVQWRATTADLQVLHNRPSQETPESDVNSTIVHEGLAIYPPLVGHPYAFRHSHPRVAVEVCIYLSTLLALSIECFNDDDTCLTASYDFVEVLY